MNAEPKDVTVHTGQMAEFECKVGGDPKPNIYWEREGNKMPFGRAQILDNKSLRIINVMAQDEGLYVCNAENDVGSEKAKASLTVHCECVYERTSVDADRTTRAFFFYYICFYFLSFELV